MWEKSFTQKRDFPTEVRQVRLCFQLVIVYSRKKLENTKKFNWTCKEQFSQPCWILFVGAWKNFCSTDSNNFFWILDVLLKLFLWTRKVQFWQPGSDFIPIYSFFRSRFGRNRKKEKFSPCSFLFLWIIAQTGRRMQVILKYFSKNLEANEMKKFFFKKHACILLKSIFNTVAICSFVCWVPCNLFLLNLQSVRKIFHTETWFFNWSSPSAFMFSIGDRLCRKKLENTKKFNWTCKERY